MNTPLSLGLLGASQVLRNEYLRAFAATSSVRVRGIASRDPAKARAWASELEVPLAYDSYDHLLADPEVEAVLITLPMNLHAEWILRAVRSGKHVLCEKPMFLTSEEAERVVSECRKTDRVVLEAISPLFAGHLQEVDRRVRNGEIGDLRAVRAEVLYPTLDWEHDSRANPDCGACVLIEAGCYCTRVLRFFMRDAPLSVKGFAASRPGVDFETTFTGVLKFPGERLGYLCTSMETSFRAVCEVIGTRGRFEIPHLFEGRVFLHHAPSGEITTYDWPAPNRFAAMLDHFAACVRGEQTPMITLEDSLANIKTLSALRADARDRG